MTGVMALHQNPLKGHSEMIFHYRRVRQENSCMGDAI